FLHAFAEGAFVHVLHRVARPDAQAQRKEPLQRLRQLLGELRQAPFHRDDDVLDALHGRGARSGLLARRLQALACLFIAFGDLLPQLLDLLLHQLAGPLDAVFHFVPDFRHAVAGRLLAERQRFEKVVRFLGRDLALLEHLQDEHPLVLHRTHSLSSLMASATVISPRSSRASTSARRPAASPASRSTLWPMASSTASSRLRTVGYEMPSTRSTSLMFPRASKNTSTNSCCSGVNRSNRDWVKRPSMTVSQLSHSSRRTASCPSQTGQRPTVRLCIRTTFRGPLKYSMSILHPFYWLLSSSRE